MSYDALLPAAAANLAGWHDLQLTGLGHRTLVRDGWWLTPDDAPGLYLRAIALVPGAQLAAIEPLLSPTGWCGISDPWAAIDLGPSGFTLDGDRPWMRRPAGPIAPGPLPTDLRIERVADAAALADFERAAACGFEATIPEAGAWHDPSTLADARQAHWLARDGRDPVGTATAFRHAGVVGIYAVSTVPAYRRRGVGATLTETAVSLDPSLPAVLQASDEAIGLYRSLGFETMGAFRTWVRAPRT